MLVEVLEVGVCGTDAEIIAGRFGTAPAGQTHLVVGHEVIGRVAEAPSDSGPLAVGDLVTVMVRRAGAVTCAACGAGDFDMCRDGNTIERGITSIDGFARQYFRAQPSDILTLPERLRATGVLTEPASVAAKAWETVDRIIGGHSWNPRQVLVTGAGPIGLLAALLSRQRGHSTVVLERHRGAKADLVEEIGADIRHNLDELGSDIDVAIECTGDPHVTAHLIRQYPGAVICLLGLPSSAGSSVDVAKLAADLLHHNGHLFGSVNAGRRHYQDAIGVLSAAPATWLQRLITRRVSLDAFAEAFTYQPGDIKAVIEFGAESL
ncbi:alcohol dehydrogenase catalytic domain-containing protein [Nocardia sp. NPDC051463]|uniref:alcohol dehydrogenase catalytic domain-containing protein n=1 Tax=Nocardia sp. NPDC051463 TaxID=3154845 RepID=UPI00344E6B30